MMFLYVFLEEGLEPEIHQSDVEPDLEQIEQIKDGTLLVFSMEDKRFERMDESGILQDIPMQRK